MTYFFFTLWKSANCVERPKSVILQRSEFYSRPWTNQILYVISKFEPTLDKTNYSNQQEGIQYTIQYGVGVIHNNRVTACLFVRVQIFNKLYWYIAVIFRWKSFELKYWHGMSRSLKFIVRWNSTIFYYMRLCVA